LTKAQALALCDKVGCNLPDTSSDKYSIAEIYNQKKDIEPTTTSKFGFI
jgi:hypothetical protein